MVGAHTTRSTETVACRPMRHSFVSLLSTLVLFAACTTSAKEAKYAADDAQLEKTHAEMQQRLDSAAAQFALFEEKVRKASPDELQPRALERTSIWLGDLEAIVASDERFMAERAAAIASDDAEQPAFLARYDELMQGHASMVAEFDQIAQQLEKRMAGY